MHMKGSRTEANSSAFGTAEQNRTHNSLRETSLRESASSTPSLTDYQLKCRDSSSLTSILMSMETPTPASAALHRVRVLTVLLLFAPALLLFTLVCLK